MSYGCQHDVCYVPVQVDLSSVPDSQAHVTVQSQSGDEQTIAAVSREGDILVATFHPSTYGQHALNDFLKTEVYFPLLS